MSAKRARVATVLRVRRVQELQAAGEFAKATQEAATVEASLRDADHRYQSGRDVDRRSGAVTERVPDRDARVLQATAIQRGRDQLRAALAHVEERRLDLLARKAAVTAMERLDERLADEEDAEARRVERRDLDEFGARRTRADGAEVRT